MKVLFWKGRTSKAAFRARFRDALTLRLPGTSYEFVEPLDLKVTGLPQWTSATLNLERAYREFCERPETFDALVERWVATIDPAKHSDGIDPAILVPMLKNRSWVPGHSGQGGTSGESAGGNGMWIEDFNAELVVAYAMYRDSFQFCQADWVRNSTVDIEELRARAISNLAERTRRWDVTPFHSVYLINVGGNFEASLLLLNEWREDSRLKVDGALFVAVPERDSLIVAQDDSPATIWALADMAASGYRKFPYPISPLIFTPGQSGEFGPLDFEAEDKSHPIPNLDVIDVHGVKGAGGSSLRVVVATALDASPRSVFRLYRKLNGHLNYIASDEYQRECGPPNPDKTDITVCLHRNSDPAISSLIRGFHQHCLQLGVNLQVEPIG